MTMDGALQAALQALIQGQQDDFNELLADCIDELGNQDGDEGGAVEEESPQLRTVRTFDEVGLLTTDKGLVLRFSDESEYQITIVCSKGCRS